MTEEQARCCLMGGCGCGGSIAKQAEAMAVIMRFYVGPGDAAPSAKACRRFVEEFGARLRLGHARGQELAAEREVAAGGAA